MAQDKHSLEGFLSDDDFIDWVLHPNQERELFWSSWLRQHPAKAAALLEARNLILLVKHQPAKPAANQAPAVWEKIEAAISQADQDTAAIHPLPARRSWFTHSRKMAASLVLAVLLAGLAYWLLPHSSPTDSRLALEKRSSPYGQRSAILLPDGSKVYLNAGSSLHYPHDFDAGSQRLVHLQGEAFFDVAKDPHKPFVVKTQALAVTVLGTRFNVKAYADEELVETTLVTGKVALNRISTQAGLPAWQQPIRLRPNQKADFSKRDGKLVLASVDPQVYTGWVEGKLLFRDSPLPEVVRTLNRAFNVRIELGNKELEGCSLTADLSNLPLSRTLEIVCQLVEARLSKEGKVMVIKGNGC